VGTTIRVTFDNPSGGMANSENYVEGKIAWKDNNYVLDSLSSY